MTLGAFIDTHTHAHKQPLTSHGCRRHCAVARHYRYVNTSCRSENNVASLLQSAQSSPPPFSSLHHRPLGAIYFIFTPLSPSLFIALPWLPTPKLSQLLISSTPTPLHSRRDSRGFYTTSGGRDGGQELSFYIGCERLPKEWKDSGQVCTCFNSSSDLIQHLSSTFREMHCWESFLESLVRSSHVAMHARRA